MDSSDIAEALAHDVTESLRHGIVNAVDQAYEVRRALFDPTVGDDSQHFGISVYKSVNHYLEELVVEDAYQEGVEILAPGQRFALRIGRFLLAPYRIPNATEHAFPYNSNGAGDLARINRDRMTQGHLFADDEPYSWQIGPTIALVIAHSGDPHSGLRSVSFREPVAETAGRISEWDYIEKIWPDAGEEGGDVKLTFPPEEPISPPRVVLRDPPDISASESDEEEDRIDEASVRSDES